MLTALELRGFRNLAAVELAVPAGETLVIGDNGAGKTSLLEAIYVLATTRSFRTSEIADCCQHGAAAFALAAEVDAAARARLSVDWTSRGVERQVNQRAASLREHLAVLPVVAWTAAEALLWTGGAQDRRRFVDRGILAQRPADLHLMARCRQVLKQKKLLLATGRVLPGSPELRSWNELLAPAAHALQLRRRAWVEGLQAEADDLLAALELALPRPVLRYRPSPGDSVDGEHLLTTLDAQANEEIARRRTLVGPQRDEVEILWSGRRTRRVASAGERKALGLIFAAAQARLCARLGRPPLVLLDDVDAELDRGRLAALWPAFAAAGQLLASSSRPEAWSAWPELRTWRLTGGRADFSASPEATP